MVEWYVEYLYNALKNCAYVSWLHEGFRRYIKIIHITCIYMIYYDPTLRTTNRPSIIVIVYKQKSSTWFDGRQNGIYMQQFFKLSLFQCFCFSFHLSSSKIIMIILILIILPFSCHHSSLTSSFTWNIRYYLSLSLSCPLYIILVICLRTHYYENIYE